MCQCVGMQDNCLGWYSHSTNAVESWPEKPPRSPGACYSPGVRKEMSRERAENLGLNLNPNQVWNLGASWMT